MTSDALTVPEKLLLAALEARRHTPTFTAEDLVVRAWEAFPDTFGLSGYADRFPDSNRVLTSIMGSKGMRGKGWLRKVGQKQYRLSSAGLAAAEELLGREQNEENSSDSAALRAELDRNAGAALVRILSTAAARKLLDGRREEVSFNDVCGFWDITSRSNARTLIARLEDTTKLLERALTAARTSGALRLGNQAVTADVVAGLLDGHALLQQQFETELGFIRKRTDERRERRARGF